MNFWLFIPSYIHPHPVAFPLSSLAGKERLRHLLGSAYTLQKEVHWVEINLPQKWDQFFISESTALGQCMLWIRGGIHISSSCGRRVRLFPSHCKDLFLLLTACRLYSALH